MAFAMKKLCAEFERVCVCKNSMDAASKMIPGFEQCDVTLRANQTTGRTQASHTATDNYHPFFHGRRIWFVLSGALSPSNGIAITLPKDRSGNTRRERKYNIFLVMWRISV